MTIRADDNWLQRRYFTWAEQHYRRMPPHLRADVERIDRWLYSRHGAVVWLSLVAAVVASSLALANYGLPVPLAVGASLAAWIAIPLVVLGAWLQPERFAGRNPRVVRNAVVVSCLFYLGVAAGFFVVRTVRHGGLDLATLGPDLRNAVADVAPLLALGVVLLGVVIELTAFARRRSLRAELELATLVGERDASARQAAEARLHLLQAQIQPHFLFNTLAALQHWVDSADPRAGPLLRHLTAFLRGSTELLGRDSVTLGDEAEMVRHYLEIMRSRLGARLAFRVEIDAACAGQPLPPGLLITLVENAVEHGIAPTLRGGEVAVRARREPAGVELVVSDDGAGLAADSAEGIGLTNCRARLQHLLGSAASLEIAPRADGKGTQAWLRVRASSAEPAQGAAGAVAAADGAHSPAAAPCDDRLP